MRGHAIVNELSDGVGMEVLVVIVGRVGELIVNVLSNYTIERQDPEIVLLIEPGIDCR